MSIIGGLKTLYSILRVEIFSFGLCLNSRVFDGKRIIVVGPAASSLNYLPAEEIDKFDYIVRINSSHHNMESTKSRSGSRTDVLFHNLLEEGERSAGRIEKAKLEAQKTQLIVFPNTTRGNYRTYLSKRRKFARENIKIYRTPLKIYRMLFKHLGVAPTTGLTTLAFFLGCKVAELHITGFTFFTSAYVPGYKENVDTDEDIKKWASDSQHNMSDELEVFRQLYSSSVANKLNVKLDRELADLVTTE